MAVVHAPAGQFTIDGQPVKVRVEHIGRLDDYGTGIQYLDESGSFEEVCLFIDNNRTYREVMPTPFDDHDAVTAWALDPAVQDQLRRGGCQDQLRVLGLDDEDAPWDWEYIIDCEFDFDDVVRMWHVVGRHLDLTPNQIDAARGLATTWQGSTAELLDAALLIDQ